MAAATVALALVGGVSATNAAGATPAPAAAPLAPGIATADRSPAQSDATPTGAPRALTDRLTKGKLPAGVPTSGRYGFLIQLTTAPTEAAARRAAGRSSRTIQAAARTQLSTVEAAQNAVIGDLPARSAVLFRTHALLAGVAVTTDVKNYTTLTELPGVHAVYPIAPKALSNSYAVPLQHAPEAWQAFGDLGANSKVAIIDTGLDYTHSDFGGAGTSAAFTAAQAANGKSTDFPSAKVAGGFDFVGDDYDGTNTPTPDPWPLDCQGHGSHVAGTLAGYGVNADGSTYRGAYDTTTPFDTMRVGPGMAPLAQLYSYRVYGCIGDTTLVSAAIDRAADPDGDGDTSDHVDVISMSLGTNFTSLTDGDSITANAAAQLGISMVAAAGNAGDTYASTTSPASATRVIAAAATTDAATVIDALKVSAPAAVAGTYAVSRALAYDFGHKPDLRGPVVALADPANLDGCSPLSAADKAAVGGKIALTKWVGDAASRRCGSVAVAGNLAAAGASGYILGGDINDVAGGISGSAVIPGVLLTKTGTDVLRPVAQRGDPLTIDGTTAMGARSLDIGTDDTIAKFSARGVGAAGDVKPDVAAVGTTVFSADSGTGNQGVNNSGTSMSTAMVAGEAALIHSLHPDWSAEQVKADIMNTGDQDVFTGLNHTGIKFAPNRVGSGRIDVAAALQNNTLAFTADSSAEGKDNGSVSASFGTIALPPTAGPRTFTKEITVQNTGAQSATYDVSFAERTALSGAIFSVSPSVVTVAAHSTATVTVTLTVEPSKLDKGVDPTVSRTQVGLPRELKADTSGLVLLRGRGVPDLRVPAYAAPRPASVMTQPAALALNSAPIETGRITLSGTPVNQGVGASAVRSTVAGFELQAVSGLAPQCTGTITRDCVLNPDDRPSDLAYVGATSSAPQIRSIGGDPLVDGMTYFAVSTHAAWLTPTTGLQFDVFIDSTGDGIADAVLFNTWETDVTNPFTDVMVSQLLNLETGEVDDEEFIDARSGETDAAVFDSDTLVLPVATAALPGISTTNTRIRYVVESFGPVIGRPPVDQVGDVDANNQLTEPLSLDVLAPGVSVFGAFDGTASPLLFTDAPGAQLTVRRDRSAYATDHGAGALIVHFHNTVGTKAQVVALNDRVTTIRQ